MNFNYNIKTIDSEKEIKKTINFIEQFPLGYKNYFDWTNKVYHQLMNGEKQAIIGITNNQIIANAIFQPIGGEILELKNIRVHEYLQKRGFAHFILNQLEIEAAKNYKGIIVDTRKDNIVANNLFKTRGYKQINQKNLYDKLNIDIIYYKKLQNKIFI
jgi:N-acetylglutamate synthase-like GNAT family acetyltransferase